ncbi:caspase recruitment domain-containing protein 19-like [Periophthalmus magnuspinnatus]|uniref:caspase recruitment domain-containing protein 19-like n=1 Tax=Periophthalmus magnuspinnatus TaxID=409849 RepID=UPI0024368574|nr:caspase recruitment domain-containing protein 19-like [Periophthalmus magnuspinnatus]
MAVSHFFGLDPAGYRRQLLTDAHFLCSHRRMDSEMLEKLVLQLNRTYPQILSDQEAQKLRNVRVLTKLRCAELLRNLHCKGEEVCKEFYRGIQIHAEDMYCRLPSRVRYREMQEPKRINDETADLEPNVLSNKGPVFFLSCFSLVVGVAILYYYRV